jgi:hypothetical protein
MACSSIANGATQKKMNPAELDQKAIVVIRRIDAQINIT